MGFESLNLESLATTQVTETIESIIVAGLVLAHDEPKSKVMTLVSVRAVSEVSEPIPCVTLISPGSLL